MKFSIITVCFNAEKTIEATIQSVLTQTYPNIEYIIIDGLSTDGTMKIVNKYRDQISKVVSEKDAGIYDAMNKGLAIATGDFVYFLNSDDILFDNSILESIYTSHKNEPAVKIFYGKVEYLNVPEKLKLTLDTQNFQYKTKLDLLIKKVIPQQSVMATREAFDIVGKFNDTYRICGDYDWLLRAFRRNLQIKYIDQYIAKCNFIGRSFQLRYEVITEKITVVRKNSSKLYFLAYFIYAAIKKLFHIFLEEIIAPCEKNIKRIFKINV